MSLLRKHSGGLPMAARLVLKTEIKVSQSRVTTHMTFLLHFKVADNTAKISPNHSARKDSQGPLPTANTPTELLKVKGKSGNLILLSSLRGLNLKSIV